MIDLEAERDRFEAWLKTQHPRCLTRRSEYSNRYSDTATEMMWRGWCGKSMQELPRAPK